MLCWARGYPRSQLAALMTPIFRTIDVETTGLDPAAGAVLLEVGIVTQSKTLDGSTYHTPSSWFVEHTGPIPPEAKAVHHITEDHVSLKAGAKPHDVHSTLIRQFDNDQTVWALHNAAFDLRFLPEIQRPTICTYRCALHLYPHAPGHGLQVLRYWLAGEPDPEHLAGLAPHRALYDAHCTMKLLEEMLKLCSVEELIRLSGAPVVLHRCRFGRHKGELWADVPKDYLRWILRDPNFDADILHTARHHLGLL